jgi:beta-galactosidase
VALEIQEQPVPVSWKRSVFNGLAQVLVQSTRNAGELKLTARSGNLSVASLSIQARQCIPRSAVP